MTVGRCKSVLAAFTACIVIGSAMVPASATSTTGAHAPVRLVIDTDLFSDVDDVGALAEAFGLQLDGEAKVLAIGVNTRTDRPAVADASPRCATAIAQFYGFPQVRIGASRPLHGTETNPVDFITPCAALATG